MTECKESEIRNFQIVVVRSTTKAKIQSAEKFSFVLSNAVVETVGVQINTIPFIFFEADVRSFEIRITA